MTYIFFLKLKKKTYMGAIYYLYKIEMDNLWKTKCNCPKIEDSRLYFSQKCFYPYFYISITLEL